MVHYLLATEEQKKMVAEVKEICDRELSFEKVKEYAKKNNGKGEYPWAAHKALAEAGYYSMSLPKEWGGRDLDFVTRGLIMEEISAHDLGFAFSFRGLGEKFGAILNSHIPEEDKKKWIDRQMTEHIGGCYCLTEPAAGSDAKGIQTTAVRDGDDWIINGSKRFITNAKNAEYYNIVAWTDKTVSAGKGMTSFLVERDRPGVEVTEQEDAMGLALCDYAGVELKNVRVPNDHIIGVEGGAFASSMGLLEGVRPYNVCFAAGAAQAALDVAVKFANERIAFGKPIIEKQDIGHGLAELQMKVDTARAMAYYALKCADDKIPMGRLAPEAKGMGIKMCVDVCNDLIEMMGAYGFSGDYPVEKIARDIRGYAIAGGTYNIMKEVVYRKLKTSKK